LELRHLRYFVALADTLHFGRAAAKLRIAQPSLTHQIQQLEAELQTPLLRRTKRRVELTDAGGKFLQEAREILARTDRAALIARRTGRGEVGRLRLAVGYCMDHQHVSKAVSLFNRRHHGIRVELQTMAVQEQLEALREDRLDAAFVQPPITEPSVTGETVSRESFVVALPPNHRLAGKRELSLSTLANEPFILPPQSIVPVFHDLVLRACREAGFVPNAPHEADHLQLVLGMVAAGSGVALVPESVRKMNRRVAFASPRPSPPELQVVVAWRREDTSTIVSEFVKTAREVLGRRRTSASNER
jgi:DNA-binding transcriptional LysR family regulator